MALPIADGKIGTPYKAKGKHWSGGIHKGVDFPTPAGSDVLACADGVVAGIGMWGAAFGKNSVLVKHKVGGKDLWCIYAHNMKALVAKGDKVTKGQHIAESGGRPGHPEDGNVTGEHLHIECRLVPNWAQDNHVDPKPLLEA